MLVKGTCQRQELLTKIHDAILSVGTWQEVSSNPTNDYKYADPMNDGYVFKSPPIGTKAQRVFFNLKSINLSVTAASTAIGNGANHFNIWLADDYTPGAAGVNGTFTNRGAVNSWCFAKIDNVNNLPTTLYDYFVDVLDHRIMIVIQINTLTTTSNPAFLYVGYPDPNTNIEGPNYTNQFVLGTNMYYNNNATTGTICWHKASNGLYNRYALTNCPINTTNPNPIGLYMLTPVTVTGDGGTGIIGTGPLGVLSGLYGMPTTNVINGDTVTIGSDTYTVFNINQYNINTSMAVGGTGGVWYTHGIIPTMIAIKTN